MERYRNLSEGSEIVAYESAGSENIEEIKELASKGEGLNSFINTNVRHYYARRER